MSEFVPREVYTLQLSHLHEKIDEILEKQEELLTEQKKTNGNVRKHETAIARIWAAGTTAWGLMMAWLTWGAQ